MRRLSWVAVLAVAICGCGPKPSPGPGGGTSTGGGTTGGPAPPHQSWLVGQGGAILSSEGGTVFGEVSSPTVNDLNALVCVRGLFGWATGSGGVLLRTRDSGQSWTASVVDAAATWRAVAFGDSSRGLLAGDGGRIMYSSDGGASWVRSAIATRANLRAAAIAAPDRASLGWAVGDGIVLRSSDGGASFSEVAGAADEHYRAVRFAADARHGFIASAEGSIYRSGDGGLTWTVAAQAGAGLSGLAVSADGLRVVAVGDGVVLLSTDGGVSFGRAEAPATSELTAVGFSDDEETGWAVGRAGAILETTDGGASWRALASPTDRDLLAIEDFE